ncbi:hypothetical protein [Okeania sp. SIO1F9]|nr:hypothetical protein [Okeania sp. SIO1F9]
MRRYVNDTYAKQTTPIISIVSRFFWEEKAIALLPGIFFWSFIK